MSSSNEVRLAYIAESTYNETPPAGDFREARFTDESLTGTPITVESPELRSDRQSSGQTNTGLEVNGDINFVLSGDTFHQDMHEAAMMDTYTVSLTDTQSVTIDTTAGTITGTGFSYTNGDLIRLSGLTSEVNNTVVYVVSSTATVITYVGSDDMVDETNTATLTVDPNVMIGTTRYGFTFEKNFLDLTNKTIVYTGERIGGMSLSFTFGENITGSYSVAGAGWDTPATPITNARTVVPIGDDLILNAASNMGMVIVDGTLATFCIESLNLELSNNLQPQNCIGELAPKDQVPFSASLSVSLTAFLGDSNFNYLQKKITQVPVEIIFFTQDANGKGFAYHLPAVQLSFPDPAGAGKDQHVMMEMEGVAKYDSVMGNTLKVYALGM